MSVLGAITTRWGNVTQLNSVVPSTQVIVGEPILGWPLPSVAITGYTRIKDYRTSSTSRIDRLTLSVVLSGTSLGTLESLIHSMLTHLPPVTTTVGTLRTWSSYGVTVARDATSEHYTITATMDFLVW